MIKESISRSQAEKKPKIVLISLYGVENIGVRSLAAQVRRAGFVAELVFFKCWYNNDFIRPSSHEIRILLDLIGVIAADVIGLSFTSPLLKVARELTLAIKRKCDSLIVWGGIHATIDPKDSLDYCDAVIRGEGEEALVELIKRLTDRKPLDDLANLSFLRGGQIVNNRLRPLVANLDSLAYPIYGGEGISWIEGSLHNCDPLLRSRDLRVFASRGCPYSCSYCYAGIQKKLYPLEPRQRRKSPEAVIAEIAATTAQLPHIRRIKFDDDSFIFPRTWIASFTKLYAAEIALPFEILYNARSFDESTLTMLHNAGLRRIQIGIQTGSARENHEIYNRTFDQKRLFAFTDACRRLKIETVYDIILDNPLALKEDEETLLDILLRLPRPYDLFIYSLNVFPGTALYQLFLERGIATKDQAIELATKSHRQFRYSFDYQRTNEELFFGCIVSLTSKSFIPKWIIRSLYGSSVLRKHPTPLKTFAEVANIMKLSGVAMKMARRGELSPIKFREYGSRRRLLIQ